MWFANPEKGCIRVLPQNCRWAGRYNSFRVGNLAG
jgi:hypothetical protein